VSCRWDYVGVSCARFYVREWVRYPSYLCTPGFGLHVRVGDRCRECEHVYASYRCNAASPYAVLRPAPRFKTVHASDGRAVAAGRVESVRVKSSARYAAAERGQARDGRDDAVARGRDGGAKNAQKIAPRSREVRTEVRTRSPERVKVVSTSRSDKAARAAVRVAPERSSKVSAPARSERDTRVVRVKATSAVKTKSKTAGREASRQKGAGKRERQAR
jgi:hypothetical protein